MPDIKNLGLPGGALVNLLLELNFIFFVDESLECP